jgi:hypothetical protein
MTGLRPFFPFYGSKWNIARHYPAPTYETVIEPFAGGAGYSTFYGCKQVRLFDADPIIVGVWEYLFGASTSQIAALPDIMEAGDSVDNYELEPGAKWLIGFWLNRGSATPKKSRTAYSARTDRGQLNWGPRAKTRIIEQLPALALWSVELGDFTQSADGWHEATWFIDPPYVDKGKFYRVGFNEFPLLGRWARSRAGQVIVCEGAGADWLPFEPIGSFKSSLGRASEVAWIAA